MTNSGWTSVLNRVVKFGETARDPQHPTDLGPSRARRLPAQRLQRGCRAQLRGNSPIDRPSSTAPAYPKGSSPPQRERKLAARRPASKLIRAGLADIVTG